MRAILGFGRDACSLSSKPVFRLAPDLAVFVTTQQGDSSVGRNVASAFIAVSVLTCVALPCHAQPVDLTGATCADFSKMSEDDRNQLALWLAGYYAGGAQRPHLDVSRITAAPGALAELCGKTPQTPLVGAETRAVFMPPAP